MGDVLKNVASEGRFPGKDVVTWLRLVMDTTDKIKVHAELDKMCIRDRSMYISKHFWG